ncbi:hypothetical protein KQI89_06780 [Clostridium sp. MSJ-4]|uniref:Glycosyltransferase RgtA/B/C/D-like domain-containing protein n=1 Tax=Clostridium simiarum TaxID=2841506 RepID=A0ABS6EZ11_9CLOT|nr:DUF6020 family protein [Clostridium simiarum]MBU5591463.1 hypothetical protein [Clostridium simiarum]
MNTKFNNSLLSILLGIIYSFTLSLYINPNNNNRVLIPMFFIVPLTIFFNKIIDELPNKFNSLSKKNKMLVPIFSFISCLGYKLVFISYVNYLLPYPTIINYSIKLFMFLLLYTSFLIFFIALLQVQIPVKHEVIPKKRILIYAIPFIILGIFYLLSFYPGVMTADSMNQWTQISKGVYYDSNPVVHTLFTYLITRIWYSPAAVVIVQVFIMSTIIGYCMYSFEKLGVDKKILYLVTLAMALNPVNGIMFVTLWKDIIYTGFILLFTMLIINIVITNNEWINTKKNLIYFILCSLGVVLFRHNGLLPLFVTLTILIILNIKKSKPYVITFISVLAIFLLIKGPIYKIIGIEPASSSEAFGIPTQQIAAVIKNNGYLTEDQLKKAEEIMPLNSWAENYMPGNVDYIKFHKDFNVDKLMEDKMGFLKLWAGACIQNPKIALKAYGSQTAIGWSVKGYVNWGSREISENSLGLKQTILSNTLTKIGNKFLNLTQKSDLTYFFWKPAFQMFFMILFAFVAILRNGSKTILVILPVLLNAATIFIATPAQDFRYLYANILVYLVTILFSFIKIDTSKKNISSIPNISEK